MTSSFFIRGIVFAMSLSLLAACDSAEERAENHYQSGLELLESGDVDRALVELRNVLSLDEFHVEARRLFATTVRDRGDFSSAYSNFLRIAEDNPKDLGARLALSEMAIEAQNWEEAERHSEILIEANADLEGVQVIDLVMKFRAAALDDNALAVEALTQDAIDLRNTYPEDITLVRIIIEGLMREQRDDEALNYVDIAIELAPASPFFYSMKSSMLAQLEDFDRLEAHLRATVQAFPEDARTKGILIQLLTSLDQPERAEDFLRDQIDLAEDGIELQVALVGFLRETRGSDAAMAEINTALERFDNAPVLRALRSGLKFDGGDREAGITEMQAIVDSSDPNDDALNGYKVTLARMLLANNNEVGARQMIEDVLANDASQVDALRLSAGWLIESDDVDQAIGLLRRALDQAPQDADALTLMAQAHQRAGEPELAQDMLSLAAEASGYAAEETIRFARTLMASDRLRPAEDALITALRQSPGDLSLLQTLGNVYLRSEDWPRALQVESTLRRNGSPRAVQNANSLRLQVLSRRDGRERAIAELEGLAQSEDAGVSSQIALLRERLRSGQTEEALVIANEIVASQPDNPTISMVLGGTHLALQNYVEAETTYLQITQTTPQFEQGWVQLMRAQSSQGRVEDARATLDDALDANPAAPNLLWAKASLLEQAYDFDGAIEIYEALYLQDSSRLIVANNLASLLATYRSDDESLNRAFAIARRLRGTEIPPFQDTYGWLLHRRGDSAGAIEYLEPAAARLASDALVQFHLASAYEGAGRLDDAREAYQRAVDTAGENDERSQIQAARAAVERLSTASETE